MPTLGLSPDWIADMADAVVDAVPAIEPIPTRETPSLGGCPHLAVNHGHTVSLRDSTKLAALACTYNQLFNVQSPRAAPNKPGGCPALYK